MTANVPPEARGDGEPGDSSDAVDGTDLETEDAEAEDAESQDVEAEDVDFEDTQAGNDEAEDAEEGDATDLTAETDVVKQPVVGNVIAVIAPSPGVVATPVPVWSRFQQVDWNETKARVLAAGAFLAVVQLALLALQLRNVYFQQDDYELQHDAAVQGFGWSYLMTPHNSHLMPGGLFIAWLTTRISPLDWTVAAATLLVSQAIGSFAVLRLLRLLFGARPAILVLFAFYLFSSLNVPVSGWWAPALEVLPFEATIAFAVSSHVLYLRTGRPRNAVAAVAWTAVGLAFTSKALVLPLLMFALTAGYFTRRNALGESTIEAARRHWRLWTAFVVILGGYWVLHSARLAAVHRSAAAPDSVRAISTLTGGLVGHTLIPAIFGGPWDWYRIPDEFALAQPPQSFVYLSWLALVCLVAVSVYFRARAVLAWLILAGYVLIADVSTVLLGQLGTTIPVMQPFLAMETRYVADAGPVIAVCVGLAFFPVLGEAEPYRRPYLRSSRLMQAAEPLVGAAALVVVVGLVVSVARYHHAVDGGPNRAWTAHTRSALAAGTPGSSILDTSVPPGINAAFNADRTSVSYIVYPLASKEQRATMAMAQPIDPVFAFDGKGFLRPVTAVENGARAFPAGPGAVYGYCFGDAPRPTMDIALGGKLDFLHPWTVRMTYLVHDDSEVTVQFGLAKRTLRLPAGPHTMYFNLSGNGDIVHFSDLKSTPALCVSALAVGDPVMG